MGKATAQVLAEESPEYHVIMGSRSLEKGEVAVREVQAANLKGTVSLMQLDVDDDASIEAAAKSIDEQFGRLDVLINNAGHVGVEYRDSPRKQFQSVLDTNSIGPVVVTEAFKPLLLMSGRGRVIFVGSGLGSITLKQDTSDLHSGSMPGMPEDTPSLMADATAYRVSKAALNMVTAHYHWELKDKGVKVHVMCPGYVHSNLRREKEPAPGTLLPETSGKTMLAIIEGQRDDDVGRFVHNNESEGVYPW